MDIKSIIENSKFTTECSLIYKKREEELENAKHKGKIKMRNHLIKCSVFLLYFIHIIFIALTSIIVFHVILPETYQWITTNTFSELINICLSWFAGMGMKSIKEYLSK